MFSLRKNIHLDLIRDLIHNLNLNLLNDYEFVIDSRKSSEKAVFCAYPGNITDGRKYIDDVVMSGAKAVIYEPGIEFKHNTLHYICSDLSHHVGILASLKHNNPSGRINTIGVTGTNGKTSVSHWLNQAYTMLGKKSGIIGTTGSGIYPNIDNCSLTTPDPITLQKLFLSFLENKVDVVAMETSSIGLHQGRVNGISFRTAIFTNLTQDHLDYHKTMEEYYQAKRDLFFWSGLSNAVINTDDEYGFRLFNELKSETNLEVQKLNIISYGFRDADLTAQNIKITLDGMSFDLIYNEQIEKITTAVIGKFNVYNLLAVAATLLIDGYSLAKISSLFNNLTSVCGRMDLIRSKGYPLIIIDFAHTPDALSNTLLTLKEIEHTGNLYCVFGCGGDRDNKKRPLMGDIAASLSDFVYITSDNPRTETPELIIEQIVAGINSDNYEVIVDREKAIRHAISEANIDDIVLIAGKGHELYQDIAGVKYHFSDFEVAKSVIK